MTLRTIYGRMRTAVQSRRLIAGFHRSRRVGFLIVVLGLSVSLAAADPAKRMFNIEAKPATQSLTDYARQAYTQLGYDVDVVDDILTNRVVGEYDSAEALELLLEDTGLEAEHGKRGIFVRRVPKREVGSDIEERTPPVAETNSLQLAQTSAAEAQATVDQNQTSRRTETDSGEDEKERPLEEIIVTGTNIRGIAPESSPTRTFSREDVQISGAGTAQDFIQTLPENFGGGSNPDLPAGLPNDVGSGQNINGGYGASVNLRGLGSGSTLVLLNGHRMAPSSAIGDFVDISTIPASTIERVEIMTDGASSIYGADAIAGVVNFILRDDFDGVEAMLRYGTVTEGSHDDYRASIAGGTNWDTGNALVVYEFYRQTNLSASDRSFSREAALPNDLLPSQRRHSALASASQELSSNLEVFGGLSYSTRDTEQRRIQLGNLRRFSPSVRNTNISGGGMWNMSGDWFVDVSSTYSDVKINSEIFQATSSGDQSFDINSNIWTTDAKLSGTLFSVPAGGVKLAVGGHFRNEDFSRTTTVGSFSEPKAQREVYAAFAEAFIPIIGPSNALPGLQRLELSASGRFSDFTDFGSSANPKVGILWSPLDGLRLRGSYSTSFKPPPLGQVGADDRSAFGYNTQVLNDLLGLAPGDPSIADVVGLSIAGTGENLDSENSRAFTVGFDFDIGQKRHGLKLTANYFDIKFEDRLGRTPNPDGSTVFNAPNIAINSPDLYPEGSVIFDPTVDQISDALRDLAFPFSTFPAGLDPFDAKFISSVGVTRNLATTIVRGFDFDVAYNNESDAGAFSLGIHGTFLRDYHHQAVVTTPLVEQVNTQFNPVDLKLRGRAGYAHNGFVANVFVNHTDSYRANNTPDAATIKSWTTVDLSLSYETQDRLGSPVLDDTTFRLSILNFFDQDPPSAPGDPNFLIFGYDPTNASPLNRFVAFELTKRF